MRVSCYRDAYTLREGKAVARVRVEGDSVAHVRITGTAPPSEWARVAMQLQHAADAATVGWHALLREEIARCDVEPVRVAVADVLGGVMLTLRPEYMPRGDDTEDAAVKLLAAGNARLALQADCMFTGGQLAAFGGVLARVAYDAHRSVGGVYESGVREWVRAHTCDMERLDE